MEIEEEKSSLITSQTYYQHYDQNLQKITKLIQFYWQKQIETKADLDFTTYKRIILLQEIPVPIEFLTNQSYCLNSLLWQIEKDHIKPNQIEIYRFREHGIQQQFLEDKVSQIILEIFAQDLPYLLQLFKNQQNLQHLSFFFTGNSTVGPQGSEIISNILIDLNNINLPNNLLSLNLSFCSDSIGAKGAIFLSKALNTRWMLKLEELSLFLQGNQIGEIGIQNLSESIGQLRNLHTFFINVWSNQIGFQGAQYLGYALSQLKNLNKLLLDVSSNELGPQGARGIGGGLHGLNKIKNLQLYIGDNNIGQMGARSIGNALQNYNQNQLISLTLYLGSNKLMDEGTFYITEGISMLNCLEEINIYLWGNQLSFNSGFGVIQSFKNKQHLQKLMIDLQDNQLEDFGLMTISQGLENLQNLTEFQLDIQSCCISNVGAYIFGITLGQMTSIKQIDINLKENQITNSNLFSIPINNLNTQFQFQI